MRLDTVIENIEAWRAGQALLDVKALYAELAWMYGPDGETNYCARLLFDLDRLHADLDEQP